MIKCITNNNFSERVSFEPVRDFNDNFSCDQVKIKIKIENINNSVKNRKKERMALYITRK